MLKRSGTVTLTLPLPGDTDDIFCEDGESYRDFQAILSAIDLRSLDLDALLIVANAELRWSEWLSRNGLSEEEREAAAANVAKDTKLRTQVRARARELIAQRGVQ